MKEIEYRNSLQARNSSYKLDEESVAFYNKVKQEEREKQQQIKERELHELMNFKLKKKLKSDSNVIKPVKAVNMKIRDLKQKQSINKDIKNKRIIKIKQEPKEEKDKHEQINILQGYLSD